VWAVVSPRLEPAIQLTLLYFDLEVRSAATAKAEMPSVAPGQLAEG
jgi:hypothetical protein